MGKEYCCNLDDLLEIFEEDVATADIISARVLAEVSASIVKYRVDNGMTQKEFAQYMDVSQGMVSKWESADYNFSIKTLADIAAKLDMDVKICLQKPGSSCISESSERFHHFSSVEKVAFRVNNDNSRPQGCRYYTTVYREVGNTEKNDRVGGIVCYSL